MGHPLAFADDDGSAVGCRRQDTDELIALPTPHPQDERGRGGDDVGWWTMRCLAWRGKIAIISAVRAFSSSWGTKAALLSRQPGCRLLPLAQ